MYANKSLQIITQDASVFTPENKALDILEQNTVT